VRRFGRLPKNTTQVRRVIPFSGAVRWASRPDISLHSRRIALRARWGCGLKRSDGARVWATVLSELAQVTVLVEWERPTWRVAWQDGPTREALMGRAAALGEYRVGAPLRFEDLRFARSNSAVAIALAWLARGSLETSAAAEPRRHRRDGCAAREGRPTGSAGGNPRRGSRADRSGEYLPVAGRRPARGVTRADRTTTGGASRGHRPCQKLPAVRQTTEHRRATPWPPREVLQRRLPHSSASSTAPDSTRGNRS